MAGEHAYFSPSASGRWIECPASLPPCEEEGNEETSSYAHEGVVCHEIAATCLVKKTLVSDYAGKEVDGVNMTPELIDGVQMYVDEVHGLTKEFGAIGGRIEQKVFLTEDCWGTVDAMIWNEDTLVCIDLKMGKGIVVPVEDNTQLKLYAVGGMKLLIEKEGIKEIKKVVTYIIQPRTPNPIRRAEYEIEDLVSFMKEKVVPIFRAHKSGALLSIPRNPGEKQCQWCKVKTCKARADKAIKDAERAFAPFTGTDPPEIDTGDKKELTLADLAVLKPKFKFIMDWIKSVDDLILSSALAGESVPGYKLVEGKANRKWGAGETKVVELLTSFGKEPWVKKLVSPTQAEKLLGKKTANETKLNSYIIKPKGKPTLALTSDKRPAMEIKEEIKDEFEEFEEDGVDPIIVNTDGHRTPPDPEKARPMSVMERMRMTDLLGDEDEIATGGSPKEVVEVDSKDIVLTVEQREVVGNIVAEKKVKTEMEEKEKFGLFPETPVFVVEEKESAKAPVPPKDDLKRYEIYKLGKQGGQTLASAAKYMLCSKNMIKMHLRYLNERDGFGYKILSDGTFRIF